MMAHFVSNPLPGVNSIRIGKDLSDLNEHECSWNPLGLKA